MSDDIRIDIQLQRSRAVMHCSDPKYFNQNTIHNILTVYDFNTERYDMQKRYAYICPNGDIHMPRCTNLDKVSRALTKTGDFIDRVTIDADTDVIPYRSFSQPIKLRESIKPKDEYQKEAVSFLCNPLPNNTHVRLLAMPTGWGKTFCALYAACMYNKKTLIIASSLTQQWIQETLDKTTCGYNKIFEIAGSIDTVKDLLSGKIHADKYDIYVATLRTLVNAYEQGLYVKLLQKLGIGLKIVDELHIATYSLNKLDLACNVMETIYLTATAHRSSPAENYVFELAYRALPSYGQDLLQFSQKYLNAIWVFYNSRPTHREVLRCITRYGFHTARYAEQIWSPVNYQNMIKIMKWAIDTTLSSIAPDEKIVIIVELLKHVSQLSISLQLMYPDIQIGDYTSNQSKQQKHDSLQKQIIVSTDESFGTGSDLHGKLRVLINTITYNSKVTATQLPGRLRRIPGKSVYYIDLVNLGFTRALAHYRTRRKVIDSFSKSVITRNEENL